jgi:hypothetical protein
VWLLARWPAKAPAFALSLLISWIGMGLPSGAVLWGIVFAAVATHFIALRNQSRPLKASVVGAMLLACTYFNSVTTLTEHRHASNFLARPLESFVYVLVYLGWPITHAPNSWIAGAAGAIGLLLLMSVIATAWSDAFDARSIRPWLWLSSYAVLAAFLAASRRLQEPIESLFTSEYSAGAFFWIGFMVIAVVALDKRFSPEASTHPWVAPLITVALIASGVNYVRLDYNGYVDFSTDQSERKVALLGLYHLASEPDESLRLLYTDAKRVRQYTALLEQHGFGPFSARMANERQRLEDSIVFATNVSVGQGFLDAAECTVLAGWAWDAQQPDVPVNVDLYDGEVLLLTTHAQWFRPDLLDAKKGNGRHSFIAAPPAALKDGKAHMIHAKISGSPIELFSSPKELVCH